MRKLIGAMLCTFLLAVGGTTAFGDKDEQTEIIHIDYVTWDAQFNSWYAISEVDSFALDVGKELKGNYTNKNIKVTYMDDDIITEWSVVN